jgi:hypothetical protein
MEPKGVQRHPLESRHLIQSDSRGLRHQVCAAGAGQRFCAHCGLPSDGRVGDDEWHNYADFPQHIRWHRPRA